VTSELTLSEGVILRPLKASDAGALARAYQENREHLAPWEPERSAQFFSDIAQLRQIEGVLTEASSGSASPFVLAEGPRIVGRVNVTGIVRGAFQSANLGYWIDSRFSGRGLMTAALQAVIVLARDELRLHRLQAATLVHNAGSQAVLRRCRFSEIGTASEYLQIAGRWQDHRLYQRIIASRSS
jgi:ribosomal-protein-alanine N-acetyltransferase